MNLVEKCTSDEEVRGWFAYHPPKGEAVVGAHEFIRASYGAVAVQMNNLLPEGEDKKEALRKLRNAMYAANACIAVAGTTYPQQAACPCGKQKGHEDDCA